MRLGVYEHFSGNRYEVTGFGHHVTGDGAEEHPGAAFRGNSPLHWRRAAQWWSRPQNGHHCPPMRWPRE
jgi:hypothetical protein